MPRCALLSMDSLAGYVVYDDLLIEPLRRLGWETRRVSWRDQKQDWNDYDLVIIRSPWDYQRDPEAFMRVLEKIDASRARLENALELCRWNLDKGYLRDLQAEGITIVPTLWQQDFSRPVIEDAFRYFGVDELIVKPTISAGADNTFRLRKDHYSSRLAELQTIFRNRPHMLQPFLPAVVDEGEYSLFYFASEYSHCILKTPREGDFRVQEEHGGILTAVEPDRGLLAAAEKTLAAVHPVPLYARLDFVRAGGAYALMELELIEPSLYFNMDPDSAARFARIIDRCCG